MKLVFAAALTFATLPLIAQEAPFRETVDVGLVLVDATVTDATGAPIIGLTADDFVVEEDGVPVSVSSVDYFTSRRLVSSVPGEQLAIDEVHEERWFVLFFHRYLGSNAQIDEMRARKDAIRWLEDELLPTDRVAVVSYDVRLRVLADFTGDVEVLRDAVNATATTTDGLRAEPAYAGDHSLFDVLDGDAAANETGRIYDAFSMIADALNPIRARKVMIVYSQGFGEDSPMTDDTYIRPVVSAMNRANVQVWGVQMPGLAIRSFHDNLARLAVETGGESLRTPVNYGTALRNADKANAGYYLLAYQSPKPPAPGESRRIQVELRNPEFRVTARPGYGG